LPEPAAFTWIAFRRSGTFVERAGGAGGRVDLVVEMLLQSGVHGQE